MNETLSLVLATAILGVSGLCLYMYKNDTTDKDYSYDTNKNDNEELEEIPIEYFNDDDGFNESKTKNNKSKKNKKTEKPSRRKY